STMSSESAPRSSTKLAVGSTWASSTPSCSTIICLTFCSTDMHPPRWVETTTFDWKRLDSSELWHALATRKIGGDVLISRVGPLPETGTGGLGGSHDGNRRFNWPQSGMRLLA